MSRQFDCIVIGGGHAGAEAAWAASRLGAATMLVTMSKDAIAKMSCNPAIGGLAKGQIVREIDALGGLMGLAIDATGIQFRMLNRSKGPAVQSPRAQADKYQYKDYVRRVLENASNLTIVEATVSEILTQDDAVTGVRCLDGGQYLAPTVVITTGTFLKGMMHLGEKQWPGGRLDEPASNELSDSLRHLGLTVGRLKTGTPVRLAGDSIDCDKLETQPGDEEPVPFSFLTEKLARPHIPCWITWTNPAVHKLLKDNLQLSPMYSGQITSVGPRYCPSIEAKIIRFADKDRHQVFLEPEDEAMTTFYCNGISTSYPPEIQEQMLRLMAGTERAKIVHYGYAIEYDYCPAAQLRESLETRTIAGLFLAGQINGTSGYEEAAGQGLIAGVNAARKVAGKSPLTLGRDQAYIGVLIDDLLTRPVDEPYRMFTSRAEYRLSLRSDNADMRLTPIGRQFGLVDDARWRAFESKLAQMETLRGFLKQTRRQGKSLWDLIKQPQTGLAERLWLEPEVAALNLSRQAVDAVATESRYEGYLIRQQRDIDHLRNLDNIRIPDGMDYAKVSHLRFEAIERLSAIKPLNLGQASRVGGITPADIAVLQIYLRKTAE
jgi:tRNA uridine 5-carboxymethylaminomethyl modification enzyme